MPANLPPQYFDAEKAYRAAKTAPEKIAALEEMLAIMPKHKGTDHLRADLRAKIAKLTQTMDKKTATRHTSMLIEKEGAAQVAIIGLPNCGKSQLVSRLTNASPTVADYPFTTQTATPAMMEFENIKIQLIDTPPLAPQTIEFWLPHMLRRADALVIIVDLGEEPLAQMTAITGQLNQMGRPKLRVLSASRRRSSRATSWIWPMPGKIIAPWRINTVSSYRLSPSPPGKGLVWKS
jgi:ribosome-interacting GTPase 1